MPDEQEVVAQPTQEAVTQEVASPETPTEQQPVAQTPPDEGKPSVNNELDEFGVPWKNRAMEYRRKLEKEREEKERLSQQQVQSQPQRQYSIAELESFALETDNPAHKQWAINEAERLREAKQSELIRKEIESMRKQTETEQVRQQTYNAVLQRNPDLYVKDASGNFMGWNQKSPLFQKMSQYLQNQEIQSHPRGVEIAEAFAIRDLYRTSAPAISQTLNKSTNELKSLQKKTLVEGGVNQPIQQVSAKEAAKNKLNKTGDPKDAAVAMREILKAQGRIKDE